MRSYSFSLRITIHQRPCSIASSSSTRCSRDQDACCDKGKHGLNRGIYEPVLRTRCAKSSRYKGPSLASPFPLWSLHTCPSLVPLSICDWVRAEQLPGWSQCPTGLLGVQLKPDNDIPLVCLLVLHSANAAQARLPGNLQRLVM